MKKVNMDVMQRWITQRITSLLGFEDDIVVGTCVNYLSEEVRPHLSAIASCRDFAGGIMTVSIWCSLRGHAVDLVTSAVLWIKLESAILTPVAPVFQ